ncbi:MAG: hypothetical protein HZB86_11900, partial [Deltaproteobacteria bacterium]|nr:hypothetical protein [Deltaproteobacteria bacterium]
MDMTTAWVPPMVAAQRLIELWLSARNRRRLLSRGGVEFRPETYRTMVVLHALFLASLTLESHPWAVPRDPLTWGCMAALAAVTILRYWAIAALGEFWNTRVIVVPGARVVRSGPYRFLRHPNYLAIVLEFLILPALMRAPATLVLFSAANLAVLRQRIRIEEGALRGCADSADRFGAPFVSRNPENGYNGPIEAGKHRREGSSMVGTPRKSAESEEEYFARLEFER